MNDEMNLTRSTLRADDGHVWDYVYWGDVQVASIQFPIAFGDTFDVNMSDYQTSRITGSFADEEYALRFIAYHVPVIVPDADNAMIRRSREIIASVVVQFTIAVNDYGVNEVYLNDQFIGEIAHISDGDDDSHAEYVIKVKEAEGQRASLFYESCSLQTWRQAIETIALLIDVRIPNFWESE